RYRTCPICEALQDEPMEGAHRDFEWSNRKRSVTTTAAGRSATSMLTTSMIAADRPQSNELAFLRSHRNGVTDIAHQALSEECWTLIVALDHGGVPTALETVGYVMTAGL